MNELLVTGHQLKEALSLKQLELATIQTQFDESLFAFKDEKKDHPNDIVNHINKLEHEIAMLQTAQTFYNLNVKVKLGGMDREVPLTYAIKIVGGAGRIAKMWRTAAKGQQRDRWDRLQATTRRTDEVQAEPVMDKKEALDKAKEAEKFAGSVRSAIATGNTEKMHIDFLDPALLS